MSDKKNDTSKKPATDKKPRDPNAPRKQPPPAGHVDDSVRLALLKGVTVDEYAKLTKLNRSSAQVRLKQFVDAGHLKTSKSESKTSNLSTLFTVGSAQRVKVPQVYTLIVATDTAAE